MMRCRESCVVTISVALSVALFAGACSARTPGGESAVPSGGSSLPWSTPRSGGTIEGTLEHASGDRTYRLYVPAVVDPAGPALVVALHGGGGNADQLERTIRLNRIAETEGFLVVYPDGSGRWDEILLTWNAGNCCGYALDQRVDDVAVLRALVEELAASYSIDRKRVYATGMSNGGMMAYRLACEAADLFAAIAPVAGALNLEACTPAEPVSVLAIHGTADQHVLFEGGAPLIQADQHPRRDRSVHQAMTFWAAVNGCDPEPLVVQSGSVSHESHPGCDAGRGVELLAILGGGHAWPGAIPFSPQADKPSMALDASEALWAFFEAHPKP